MHTCLGNGCSKRVTGIIKYHYPSWDIVFNKSPFLDHVRDVKDVMPAFTSNPKKLLSAGITIMFCHFANILSYQYQENLAENILEVLISKLATCQGYKNLFRLLGITLHIHD